MRDAGEVAFSQSAHRPGNSNLTAARKGSEGATATTLWAAALQKAASAITLLSGEAHPERPRGTGRPGGEREGKRGPRTGRRPARAAEGWGGSRRHFCKAEGRGRS